MSSVSKLSAVYGGVASGKPVPSSPNKQPAPSSPSTSTPTPTSSSSETVRVYIAGSTTPAVEFQANATLPQILAGLGWSSSSSGALTVRGGRGDVFVSHVNLPAGEYDLHRTEPMKFKVTLQTTNLIIPYAFPCLKIKSLMDEISFRFAKYYVGSLQISELRTSDGYLINKFDTIRDVLNSGDYIQAVDFKTWLTEVEKTCKEEWLEVSQSDFIDEEGKKWVSVGRTTNNQLYVQAGIGRDTKKLEVFDLDELKDYSKEGTTPIITIKGGEAHAPYHMIVSFTIEQGVVTSVLGEVKAASDLQAKIVRQDFKVAESGKLEKTTNTLVQSSELPVSDLPPPSLPAAVHRGPSIDELLKEPKEEAPLKNTVIYEHLRVEQNERIDADQQWARDGCFSNQIMVNLLLINSSPDKKLSILRIKSQIKINGEWKDAESSAIGTKRGYYHYQWTWDESSLDLGPTSQTKISVLAGLKVSAHQVDKQRRVHHSIPSDPLALRIVFEDYAGKVEYFEVEYRNPKLDTTTEEQASNRVGKGTKFDKYVYADDTEAEARQYIAIRKFVEGGNARLEVYMSNNSSYYYIYPDTLKASVFQAIKENKTEVPIESLVQSNNDDKHLSRHVLAIVDAAHRRVVALKLQIKTTTGYTEDYFVVPHLETAN